MTLPDPRQRGRPRKYATPEEAAIAKAAQTKASRDRNAEYYRSEERKAKQRERAKTRRSRRKIVESLNELLAHLKKIKAESLGEHREDDFNACDFGQYDDAYDAGVADGELYLAEHLIEVLEGKKALPKNRKEVEHGN